MAFVIKGSIGAVIEQGGWEFPKGTATAFAVGDILMRDTANNVLIRATSGAAPSDANTGLFGVCVSVEVAANTTCRAVPLIYGMLLEADTNANTATAHNLQRMVLTDFDTLNNSGTDSTANEGQWLQIAPIGVAADRKALVMYVGAGNQVVA